MDIEQRFSELCRGAVAEMGFNLVRVSWAERELCLYIDRAGEDDAGESSAGGVSLDDCEIVTKAVESIIDANDAVLGENYSLSVSSIGADGKDWK
jgi:ribosome maturation factor RimP